jgi:uncharacterized protein YkwD
MLSVVVIVLTVAGGRVMPSIVEAKQAPVPKPSSAKPAATKPSAPGRSLLSAEEQIIFDLANRERAAHRLPALQWNAALASAARAHAQKMAQAGTLSHQFEGEMDMGTRFRVAGVQFRTAAENVALGPTAADIHAQWMKSPGHRDNILDPALDSLGVAVVVRNGQLFTVQDFTQAIR